MNLEQEFQSTRLRITASQEGSEQVIYISPKFGRFLSQCVLRRAVPFFYNAIRDRRAAIRLHGKRMEFLDAWTSRHKSNNSLLTSKR